MPGQAGYKQNETEYLEKEAKDMEVRLQLLQARMQQQNEDDAALAKPGGARWRSARTDKGSVTAYAKDVQERIKKRAGLGASQPQGSSGSALDDRGSFAKATAAARRQVRHQGTDFRTKDIHDWTVEDVRDWLNAILLSQYAPLFETNEINGPILLEISLEDLDYMGMTILGHRKVLLKGIEDLRKNRRVTINLSAAAPSGGGHSSGLTSQSLENLKDPLRPMGGKVSAASAHLNSQAQADESPGPYMHWSQLEPLSRNQVQVSDGRGVAVNLADGEMIDEAAEQAAFSDAVMEWRRGGGGRVNIEREGDFKDSGSNVGASLSKTDGTFSLYGSGASASGLLDFNEDDEDSDLLSAREKKEPSASVSVSGAGKARPYAAVSSTSSYLQQGGMLDEAAEREEFRRAVEEWRTGGSKSSVSKAKAAGEAGPATEGLISPRGSAGRSVAERLAKELEDEQAASQLVLQLQRQEAQRKLALANRELEEARRSRMTTSTSLEAAAADLAQTDAQEETRPSYSYSYSQPPEGLRVPLNSAHHSGADALTPPLSPHLSDDDNDCDARPLPLSRADAKADAKTDAKGEGKSSSAKVTLSLVETSMGSTDFDAEDKQSYLVEEASDDD